ncbi:hypothetical protein AQUSIP_02150 [Aquicella siphonis]|uniref:Uncharacterized protein n=1 Tax=Aquicella siphonis TaxID=254247 RepID=A0A5E4PF07_9COXI|nr:hypothetical protein [Aquicella siphonis]VVC74941.1 hypothetical protein AQUSIP_02150 [Aquicella siphonis]
MKRLLILFIALAGIQTALADDAANIKIKINGAMGDNRYFLCLPDVGCLSMLAAQKGKIYPIFHSVDLSEMYITDTGNSFHLSAQNPGSSCNTSVDTNQTVTITGNLANKGNGGVSINQLHCKIS